MYKREATILNPTGLHARPASDFVKCAANFKSDITIGRVSSEKTVNAKSIVMLLTQAFSKGTQVCVSAEGEDEKQAVDTLIELIESGFSEGLEG